jgi:hypothetical protein
MTDIIDSLDIDVDIDTSEPPITVAELILEGDFVTTFEKYLEDTGAQGIRLRLPRKVAEDFLAKLTGALYG